MSASRELYWNINGHGVMYLLFLVALVIFGYGCYRQYKLWRIGLPDKRTDDIPTRIYNVIVHTLGHKRIFKEGYAGSLHGMIFYGFIIFVIGTTVVALQADLGLEIYKGSFYLWLSLLLDLGGLAAIVGILMAYYRRYVLKPDRLDNKPDDAYSLHLLLSIIVSGFILEGLRMAATQDPWAIWSPVGLVFAKVLGVLGANALGGLHVFFWWGHLLLAFGFIAYLPYSKLLHIITTPLNQFFNKLTPKGALTGVDFENEELENYGISQLEHFTWKQLFDTAACTRCGRCQDNCPAYLTEKPLSPKAMTQDLKAYLEECAAKQSGSAPVSGDDVTAETAAAEEKTLVGGVFSEDTIWSCTTCRACQEQCPALVEHIDKTIGMRRHLVLEESNFPAEVQTVFRNLENNSNPWGVGFADRAKWADGLDVKVLADDADVDILYWPGCAGAFDDRNKKVATAVVKIMQTAGVNFGILGTEEKCCGDSARRIGNEYLFQMTAEENIETIKSYGIKKIVTHCPHCFNTLKNEYPEFGADFEVVHHTQFIAELIDKGELYPCKQEDLEVTYHDSCYLGRYNDEYQAPRQIIANLGGSVVEMEKNKSNSFCCGAGGGRMWMEETLGSRINEERTQQAVATGAGAVVTNCPFCLTMIEDGLKEQDDKDVKSYDIAELVADSL